MDLNFDWGKKARSVHLFFPECSSWTHVGIAAGNILSDTFVPNKFGVLALYDADLCSYFLVM
jgi:hypothetical protein